MKLQLARPEGRYSFSGCGPGYVTIGGERRTGSLLVTAEAIQAWPVTAFEALALEHFALIAALQPELVVFGTGPRLRFPRPEWVRPLLDARIGIESMDTRAACRTYNVLMSEGRRVAAAVLAP